jgi:hypothetical protein
MFLIITLQILFDTEFIVMFMICLYTKFLMCTYNGALVITIQPEVKYQLQADVTSFYILQETTLTRVVLFS